MQQLDQSLEEQLKILQDKYKTYWAQARRHQHVPIGLKAETIKLIRSGVDSRALREACRLNTALLRRWQKSGQALGKDRPEPRILKVIGSASSTQARSGLNRNGLRVIIEGGRIVIETMLQEK